MPIYQYTSKYGDDYEIDLPEDGDLDGAIASIDRDYGPSELQKWTTHSAPVNKLMEYGNRAGKGLAEFSQNLSDDPKATGIGLAQGAAEFAAQGAAMPISALQGAYQFQQDQTERATEAMNGGKPFEFKNPITGIAANMNSNLGAIGEAMRGEGMDTYLQNHPKAEAASKIPGELLTPLNEGIEAMKGVSPTLGASAELLMALGPLAAMRTGKPKPKPNEIPSKVVIPETIVDPLKGDTPALLNPEYVKRLEEAKKEHEASVVDRPNEIDKASGVRVEDTTPALIKPELGEQMDVLRRDRETAALEKPTERALEGTVTEPIVEPKAPETPSLLSGQARQEAALLRKTGDASSLFARADLVLDRMIRQPGTTASTVLQYLVGTEKNLLYKKLGEILLPRVGHIPIKMVDGLLSGGREVAGAFVFKDGEVHINSKGGATRNNIYHELVHAATSHWLLVNKNHPLSYALEALMRHSRNDLELSAHTTNAGVNIREFIADAFSNPLVAKTLDKIKLPKDLLDYVDTIVGGESPKTVWQAFKQTIAAILSKGTDTALAQTVRVVSAILDDHIKSGLDQVKAHDAYVQYDLMNNKKSRLFGDATPYEKITSERTFDDFHKNWRGKLLEKDKLGDLTDIKGQVGFSSESYRIRTAFMKHKDAAHAVGNFLADSVQRLLAYESSLMYKAMPSLREFTKKYSVLGSVRFHAAEFKRDVGLRLEFEKDPKSWGGGPGKWYPTEAEMVARGMSPSSAKVWAGIDKVMDLTWDSLARSAKLTGTKIPPRIAGYVPHMFKGAYRVQAILHEVGKKGDPIHWYQYNFDSTNQAKALYQQAMKDHNGQVWTLGGRKFSVEIVFDKPEILGSKQAEKLVALWDAEASMPIPALKKSLDKLFKDVTEGSISHVMERNVVPQKGHLLERVNMKGKQGLDNSHMKDAVNSFERYAEAVFGWEVRAKYATEFLLPLKKEGYFEGRPNLRDFVERMSNAFFGISKNKLEVLAKPIELALDGMGLDPRSAKHLSQGLTSAVSVYYLTFNPGYYIVNTLQVMNGLSILMNEKAKLALAGFDVSVSSALLDYAISGKMEKKMLKDYAEEHGFARAQFTEELIPGQSYVMHKLGTPSRFIDSFTRVQGYNMAYHLAKQVMSEADAKTYAGHVSREINVPYNANAGAPLLFGELGMFRPLAMFMTFQAHQLGALNQMRALAARGIEQKNPKVVANAVAAMTAYAATQWALFGLAGLPFASNWDNISFFLSNVLNIDTPSIKEVARSLDTAMPYLPSAMNTFGLVSLLIGGDITGSGSGVSFPTGGNIGDVSLNFLSHIAQGALISGKWVWGQKDATKQPTKREIADWIKTAPPGLKQYYEFLYKHDMGEYFPVLMGKEPKEPDLSMSKDPNLPGLPRTAEETTRSLLGLVPLREAEDKITDISLLREEREATAKLNKIVKLLLDAPLDEKGEWIQRVAELATELGENPYSFIKQIGSYEVQKSMNKKEREAYLNRTLKGALSQQRRERYDEKIPAKFRY